MAAEKSFRDAFVRLQNNAPLVLPKGSPVTQNNIAREAGCDPSALRKRRYPLLIEEIQQWIDGQPKKVNKSERQESIKQRSRNRQLRDEIACLKAERDLALSLLVEADAKILELTIENARLESHRRTSNITSIRGTPR